MRCLGGALLVGAVMGLFPSDKPKPVTWSVAIAERAPQGAQIRLRVTAQIERGWHLYAMTGATNGTVHTTITVPPGQGYTLGGPVTASAPATFSDETTGSPYNAYEDSANFTVPVVAAPGAVTPSGLHLMVRYQACSGTRCMPVQLADLTVELPPKP